MLLQADGAPKEWISFPFGCHQSGASLLVLVSPNAFARAVLAQALHQLVGLRVEGVD